MTTPNQWIERAERLPTEADGNEFGFIYFIGEGRVYQTHWESETAQKHCVLWCPIAKAPPLPKPKELTQEEKDYQAADKLIHEWVRKPEEYYPLAVKCIQYGRAEGRRELAQQCLVLFGKHGLAMSYIDDNAVLTRWTAQNLQSLHDLLTKAAKP